MSRVEAGSVADCGTTSSETARCSPATTVPAFYLDDVEVTVDAYARCVEAGTCAEPRTKSEGQPWLCTWPKRAERKAAPMTCVQPDEARTYCAWKGARLPEAKEWLRALRLQHPGPYLWEGKLPELEVGFALGPCWGRPAPCDVPHWRAPQAHAWDLVGNVAEWTTSAGAPRIMGLSWADPDPHDLALLRLDWSQPGTATQRSFRVGFRCARNVE